MSKTRSIITKCRNQSKYDYIVNLRSQGQTYEQIGSSYNPKITRQAVHKIVKNYERRWGTKNDL